MQMSEVDKTGWIKCNEGNHLKPPEQFIGNNGNLVKQCKDCRKKKSERDRKRNAKKRIRNRERIANEPGFKEHSNAKKQKRMKNVQTVVRKYFNNAKDRKIEFLLTEEQVSTLVNDLCFYCEAKGNPFIGIDRFNNLLDYTVENSVACCKMCNYTKVEWSASSYVAICGHIATVNGLIGGPLIGKLFHNNERKGILYTSCKSGAERRDLDFEITKEQLDYHTSLPCTYCKKPNSNFHNNALDRIDNTKGYLPDNIQSCCGTCNGLKLTLTHDEFLSRCSKVWTTCVGKVKPIQGELIKEKRPKVAKKPKKKRVKMEPAEEESKSEEIDKDDADVQVKEAQVVEIK